MLKDYTIFQMLFTSFNISFVDLPLLVACLVMQLTCCLPQVYVLLDRWYTPLWVLIVGSQVNDLLRRWYTPLWVLILTTYFVGGIHHFGF